MEFSYNPYSNESRQSQWMKYLQNAEYVNKITSEIENSNNISIELSKIQAKEAKKNINFLTEKIDDFSNSISNNLEEGFYEMNQSILKNNISLNNISDSLYTLSNIVSLGFQRLSEELKITNFILGKIEHLIKVPESQKQRYYYIEEGLKFLKNGFNDGKDSKFYKYAFDEFSNSINLIDKKDYFSLYYLGYLYLEVFIDLEKAEIYSSEAGDFFKAEGLVNGTISAKAMNGVDFSYNQRAIESYNNAARACYSNNNIEKAINYCDKCLKLNPNDITSLFLKAKYLVVNNNSEEAVIFIKQIIKINKYYPPLILLDSDLFNDIIVQTYLKNLTIETIKKSVHHIKSIDHYKIQNNHAQNILVSVNNLISKKDYISSCKAIDILFSKSNFHFVNYPIKKQKGFWDHSLNSYYIDLNIFEFVHYELIAGLVKNKILQINQLKKEQEDLEKQAKIKINEFDNFSFFHSELAEFGFQIMAVSSMFLIVLYPFFRFTLFLKAYDNLDKPYYQYSLIKLLIIGIIIGFFLMIIGLIIRLNKQSINNQLKNEFNKKLNNLAENIKQLTNEIDNQR